MVTPQIRDHHHRSARQVWGEIDREVARVRTIPDLPDQIERLLRNGTEQLAPGSVLDVKRPHLATVAMDRRQVDAAFAPVDANADRHRWMTIELHVGDPDQAVAARTVCLSHDHRDVVRVLHREVRTRDRAVATGDTEVPAIDWVHEAEL